MPQPMAPTAHRSLVVAYALWAAFAAFGVHRFYARQSTSACVMLALTLGSVATAPLGIGLIGLVLVVVWVIGDAFLLPGMLADAESPAGGIVAADVA